MLTPPHSYYPTVRTPRPATSTFSRRRGWFLWCRHSEVRRAAIRAFYGHDANRSGIRGRSSRYPSLPMFSGWTGTMSGYCSAIVGSSLVTSFKKNLELIQSSLKLCSHRTPRSTTHHHLSPFPPSSLKTIETLPPNQSHLPLPAHEIHIYAQHTLPTHPTCQP